MKSAKYQRRFYRDWRGSRDLFSQLIAAKESDLEIFTNKPLDKSFVEERLRSYRNDIENYIDKDRRFLTALKPLEVELGVSKIVREMSECSRKAGVGPMAAVAGAIAQFLGSDLLLRGYKDVIVENGGDIFLKTTKTRLVGIYAGKSKVWNRLKLKISPSDTPLGICTSSGTLGHSLSFGLADSVTILSKSASLSDAVATATCNRVRSKEDLNNALEFARKVPGVIGAVILIKNNMLSWGKIKFHEQD
jgi:uncharacterized protein